MKRKIVLSVVLIAMFLVGCNREVSTVKFKPEEITTEENVTEAYMGIIYTNSNYETKILEPDTYLSQGDIITSKYVEANITLPEGVFMVSTYVSGYDIFYSTNSGSQAKVMRYNYLSGETTEIKSYDKRYNIDIIGAKANYIVWAIYSYDDPLYGYDGTEKYTMCEIMNIENGEIVEFTSLGAGTDFLGFAGDSYIIGMDYDSITWEGTIYTYDFVNQKTEVILEGLHNFRAHVSNDGYIIIELCYDTGNYGFEIYDFTGKFIQRLIFPTYGDNVQYNGNIFAISIREDEGRYIYIFNCYNEKLYKYKYNGTYEFVCHNIRVYTRGNNNSGVKVFEVGDFVAVDEKYIEDNVEIIGCYSFGIYTYLYETIDNCESYTFKFYDD